MVTQVPDDEEARYQYLMNIINNKKLETNKSNIPWVTQKTIDTTGILKLHYEILDFFNLIKPKEEENSIRLKTFNLFKNLVNSKWPNWNVEMFGSFPTNIHLPDSDIDAVVFKENISTHKSFNSYIRDSIISESDQLNDIYRELMRRNFVDDIRYVDARVPIVKIRCKSTQVRMDIT